VTVATTEEAMRRVMFLVAALLAAPSVSFAQTTVCTGNPCPTIINIQPATQQTAAPSDPFVGMKADAALRAANNAVGRIGALTGMKAELEAKIAELDRKSGEAVEKAKADLETKINAVKAEIESLKKGLGGLCSAQALQNPEIAKLCVEQNFAKTDQAAIEALTMITTAAFPRDETGKLTGVSKGGSKAAKLYFPGYVSITRQVGADGSSTVIADYRGVSRSSAGGPFSDDHPHATLWLASILGGAGGGAILGGGIAAAAYPDTLANGQFRPSMAMKGTVIGAGSGIVLGALIGGIVEGVWASED